MTLALRRALAFACALFFAGCAARTERPPMTAPPPSTIVRTFFDLVRSGRAPDRARALMAPRVLAHQLTSEGEHTVERTPDDYAAHVREMLATYGDFRLEVTEMLADGDRVYVRWRQTGVQRAAVDGYPATGRPIVEIASAVYRVRGGKIAEYWIQIDREGLRLQLERAACDARGANVGRAPCGAGSP